MRIAVDASVLETARPTGVERALREQLRALAAAESEVGRAAARHEFLLIARRPIELGFALPAHFRGVDLAAHAPGRFWREALLDPLLRRDKVALLHSPVLALPLGLWRAPYAMVATVHEVPWREPGGGDGLEVARRFRLSDAARRARGLVAVSQRTRDHVVALHPQAAARTVVIPHGVEPRFAPQPPAPLAATATERAAPPSPRDLLAAERAALLARYRLPDAPFLLFVGAARARKNLAGLLAAYAALPAALRERHPLLLAGVTGEAVAPLQAQAQQLRITDRLLLPGFIDDADLPALYRAAHALLFPSRFEGFGLPLLEAMASGLPVVASRGGALPEVAGDAALLLDEGDGTAALTAALTAAIVRIATDTALREQLRARGLARAARFRWSRAAEQLLALWEGCA